jgi:hypothetical protein
MVETLVRENAQLQAELKMLKEDPLNRDGVSNSRVAEIIQDIYF